MPCFIEIHAFNAKSEDPDQTPCSAAFDLGLHCLPMSILWDARHKWVEGKYCEIVLFPFQKRFIVKGRTILPSGVNSFLLC